MLREDLSFQILRHIEMQPDLTQRELAQALGISLGRVNHCVRALVEKGMIKARNFRNSRNKRAYLYHLTPEGIAEKMALTVRFIHHKEHERRRLLREIETLKAEIGRPAGPGAG